MEEKLRKTKKDIIMKKKYTRKSNPVNNTGYTPGYSTENNPFNIIPSENITMRNTPYPVQGTPLDQNGYPMGDSIAMQPGQDYKFGGASFVFETPNFAKGGTKQNWISDKIGKLMREGYPQKQAIAIAYSMYNQNHGNGGYQLPMYQFAGTANLDAFGQPIAEGQTATAAAPTGGIGDTPTFGKPPITEEDPMEALKSYEAQYKPAELSSKQAAKEASAGVKESLSMTGDDTTMDMKPEKLKNKYIREAGQEEDPSKKAREQFEGNGITQFYNPYGGYGMQESLFNAGEAVEKGDTFGAIANSANVLLKGSKDFLAGMGSANMKQQQKQDYYQNQREGMTGQNTPTALRRGGRFSTFKLGGYQLPMYQEAGLYPGEEEDAYGDLVNKAGYSNFSNKDAAEYAEAPKQNYAEESNQTEEVKTPSFDSTSARDMWVHKTGMPWSKAKELGYTTGSAQDNMKLLSELKDERFKKENLRTEAPKRKTANRKAIDLKPKPIVYKQEEPNNRPVFAKNTIQQTSLDRNLGFPSISVEAYRNYVNTRPAENNKQENKVDSRKIIFTRDYARANRNYRSNFPSPYELGGYYQEGGMQSPGEEQMEGQMSNPQEEQGEVPQQEQMQQMMQQISEALQQGADPQQILQQLMQMGIPQQQAQQMVEMAMQELQGGQQQAPQGTPQLRFGGEMNRYAKYQTGGKSAGMTQAELNSIAKKYNKTPAEFLEIINEGGAVPDGGTMIRVGGGNTGVPKNYLEAYREEQSSMPNTIRRMPEMMKKTANKGLDYLGIDYEFNNGGYYQDGGEEMDEEMEGEDEGAEGESPSMEQIEDQVEQALKQGADPQQILEQLIQMGMPEQQAVQMIQEILQEIQGGETEMEAPEQGNPQMRAGGKYLEILKGKTIKSYSLNKKTGNYEVQYS